MKEICIINYGSDAAVYGIGTYIKEYVHCLLKIGCKVNLIELGTSNVQSEVYIKEDKGVRTIFIPYVQSGNFVTYNKSVCRLLRLYLEDSSDLVFHFHYQLSNSLLDGLKQYFPLSGSILTVHYLHWSAELNGNLSIYKDIIRRRNHKSIKKKYQDIIDNYEHEKRFVMSVDQVVCLSEDTYKLLSSLYGIGTDKLTIIPNGLTAQRVSVSIERRNEIRKKYHIAENEKIILFVGRINPIKGIQPLLAAFNKVIEGYPSCRLIIIGDGDFNKAIQLASYDATKITFTGKLDKKTLYQWYQIADLATFPSYYEECSYVGIEMQMHGIPIVASDGYAVKNMFADYNASIAHIGDWNKMELFTSELSKEILTLLHSDELSALKSRQSLQSYKKVYHLRHMKQKYATLFAALPLKTINTL